MILFDNILIHFVFKKYDLHLSKFQNHVVYRETMFVVVWDVAMGVCWYARELRCNQKRCVVSTWTVLERPFMHQQIPGYIYLDFNEIDRYKSRHNPWKKCCFDIKNRKTQDTVFETDPLVHQFFVDIADVIIGTMQAR